MVLPFCVLVYCDDAHGAVVRVTMPPRQTEATTAERAITITSIRDTAISGNSRLVIVL
jgi:hypothetical protein